MVKRFNYGSILAGFAVIVVMGILLGWLSQGVNIVLLVIAGFIGGTAASMQVPRDRKWWHAVTSAFVAGAAAAITLLVAYQTWFPHTAGDFAADAVIAVFITSISAAIGGFLGFKLLGPRSVKRRPPPQYGRQDPKDPRTGYPKTRKMPGNPWPPH